MHCPTHAVDCLEFQTRWRGECVDAEEYDSGRGALSLRLSEAACLTPKHQGLAETVRLPHIVALPSSICDFGSLAMDFAPLRRRLESVASSRVANADPSDDITRPAGLPERSVAPAALLATRIRGKGSPAVRRRQRPSRDIWWHWRRPRGRDLERGTACHGSVGDRLGDGGGTVGRRPNWGEVQSVGGTHPRS